MTSALAAKAKPATKTNEDEIEAVREMIDRGMTCAEIGAAIGKSMNAASHIIKKYGLRARDARPDFSRIDRITTYRDSTRITLPRISMHVAALEARP
ncbi:hypothetical protein ACRQ1B_28830 [Rhizobium panacihumi]|uniref:hypothetical protein n=1 Tax=Rhizobium panacihumi TaxID=2008450 RepID=UPI003D7C038C